jgi:hypothetical protein
MSPIRAFSVRAGLVVFGILIAWALCEISVLFLLDHPPLAARLPGQALDNLVELYRELDRPIIQFDPSCARYDPDLFYTLRPGRCEYRSREFSTHYEINRIGVRDDAASLEAPDIIVAGDSFAMGWGVEQEETFAQLIERRSGRRVLNTAISSYGTVREMRMLDRVDLSRATHLIIQYCANDVWENIPFLRKPDERESLDAILEEARAQLGRAGARDAKELYRAAVLAADAQHRYWFGRYTWWLFNHFIEKPAQAETSPDEEPPPVQAEAFVNALVHAPHQKLDHLQLIVLEMWAPDFLDAVEEVLKKRPDLPPFIRGMKLVRFQASPERYILDDHWTPGGHREVADRLMELLTR